MRIHWDDIPHDVRAAFEQRLGGRVVEATTQRGGFSPGLAARLRLEDGRRYFLKAVHEGANPDTPEIHRREARIVASLPAGSPAPRLLWSYDEAGWVALCLEDVDGRHPDEPWTEHDLGLVIAALREMAAALTPAPMDPGYTVAAGFRGNINDWQVVHRRGERRLDPWARRHLARLARLEAGAPDVAGGDTLLHFDLRADNILISGERVYVIDWPWARTGAPWIDWVGMAPSVAMQGGPDPETFLRRFGIERVSPQAIDAVVCTIAGYFNRHSLEVPPPGLPTLRQFQAAQGRIAVAWLHNRLGWD